MKTLHHPVVPGVTVTVPGDAAADWRASGWLTKPPTPSVPASEPGDTTPDAAVRAATDKE